MCLMLISMSAGLNIFINVDVFVPWGSWIQESQSLLCDRGYESSCKVWSGKDVLGIFHGLGITADTFHMLQVDLLFWLYS